jgi:hypothetical protein
MVWYGNCVDFQLSYFDFFTSAVPEYVSDEQFDKFEHETQSRLINLKAAVELSPLKLELTICLFHILAGEEQTMRFN